MTKTRTTGVEVYVDGKLALLYRDGSWWGRVEGGDDANDVPFDLLPLGGGMYDVEILTVDERRGGGTLSVSDTDDD